MTQDTIVTVRLNTVEETSVFGNAFGSGFLHPLVYAPDPKNRQSLVVGVFGASGTGKTAWLEAAYDAVSPEVKNSFLWDKSEKEQFSLGDLVFRRTDFGALRVMEDVVLRLPVFQEKSKANYERLLQHAYFPPRENADGPGADFFEHPSIAHVQPGGALVFAASSARYEKAKEHLAYTSRSIRREIRGLKSINGVSDNDVARASEMADRVTENMAQVRDVLEQQIARYGAGKPFNIMRAVLTHESEPARAAFHNFRAQAAKTLELIG